MATAGKGEVAGPKETPAVEPRSTEAVKVTVRHKYGAPLQVEMQLTDTLQDLRQVVFDTPATCHVTCFEFECEGRTLHAFAELGQLKLPKYELDLVDAPYDEVQARTHVRRMRELLMAPHVLPSYTLPGMGVTVFSSLTPPKEEGGPAPADLTGLYPPAAQEVEVPECLKSITFSGWNPPPGNRKLQGDLFYLEVITSELDTVFVTASTAGFFVNQSQRDRFNPMPAVSPGQHVAVHHNISDLLERRSLLFKKNFTKVREQGAQRHQFELLPTPFSHHPWAVPVREHKHDANRAEDALLLAAGSEVVGQLRDWNDEYQNARELPARTFEERILRDSLIFKIYCDFVETAVRGACAAVNNLIPPVNPVSDPPDSHMFIYNNVFFTFAVDAAKTLYAECGGEEAALMAPLDDLEGVVAFNHVDTPKLYTVVTAVVDYRGHRILAQAILPGVFQRDESETVVYGSIDNGAQVVNRLPEFYDKLKEAAVPLHMAEHAVRSPAGTDVAMCSAVETKGIRGTDGRLYVLDVARTTPRDANWLESPNALLSLRRELVEHFYRHKNFLANKDKFDSVEKAEEAARAAAEKGKAPAEEGEGAAAAGESKEDAADKVAFEEVEVRFNVNVFTKNNLADAPEKVAADEALVREASEYLVRDVVPKVVEDVVAQDLTPTDGETFVAQLHKRGVSDRYVGQIATLLGEKHAYLHGVCVQEMVTQAAHHFLCALLRGSSSTVLATTVAHFLNCYLGDRDVPAGTGQTGPKQVKKKAAQKKKGKKGRVTPPEDKDDAEDDRKEDDASAPDAMALDTLSHASLWPRIVERVKNVFRFDLVVPPATHENAGSHSRVVAEKLSSLRSLCKRAGVQLRVRRYDFEEARPFSVDDVVDLVPVVRHADPRSKDGRSLLESGRLLMYQNAWDMAYTLFMQALAVFTSVHGYMHVDTAQCYQNIAILMFKLDEPEQAYANMNKAIVIYERVLGLDSDSVAFCYKYLGIFCISLEQFDAALTYLLRARYIFQLNHSASNPEIPQIDTHIGVVYHRRGNLHAAAAYHQSALRTHEETPGTDKQYIAASVHHLAAVHATAADFGQAVELEKRAVDVFTERFGADNDRTMQAQQHLAVYQQNAKSAEALGLNLAGSLLDGAPRAALPKAKPAKAKKGGKPTGGASAAAEPAVTKEAAAASARANDAVKGHLPVGDLLKFIDGNDGGAAKAKKGSEDTNTTNKKKKPNKK